MAVVGDSASAADMEGVEGPGLRDIDDTRVLLPEYRVIPQPGDPQRHKQEGEGKGIEEEEAVAVQEEALALLVQDKGQHGEEGEDEEDEDLALGDQVPEEASGGGEAGTLSARPPSLYPHSRLPPGQAEQLISGEVEGSILLGATVHTDLACTVAIFKIC